MAPASPFGGAMRPAAAPPAALGLPERVQLWQGRFGGKKKAPIKEATERQPKGSPRQGIGIDGPKLEPAAQQHKNMKSAMKLGLFGTDAIEDSAQGIGEAAKEQQPETGHGHHLDDGADEKDHAPTHQDVANHGQGGILF